MNALIANIKHAIRNRETTTIGGGAFGPEEMKELVQMHESNEELLKALNSLRSAAYWIVEGGEFAHWVNDKTMPLAAAKELAELAEMVQAAQAITDKATTGETK